MEADLERIIAQIPGWSDAQGMQIERAPGETNTNYQVTVNGGVFMLRISGKNTAQLGINRRRELEALRAAAEIGIGPEVVYSIMPAGHLVTRWIEGRQWKKAEYWQTSYLQRMVEAVKCIHHLPPIQGTFSPFILVRSYAIQAMNSEVPFPEDIDDLLAKMDKIEAFQQQDRSDWLKLCHNDLNGSHFLDDGSLRFLDWEYAGMGDIYFDLARLSMAFDLFQPLPGYLEEFMLDCYFGSGQVNDVHHQRLASMKFMVLLLEAMRALLLRGLQMKGSLPVVEWLNYEKYANNIFKTLRKIENGIIC